MIKIRACVVNPLEEEHIQFISCMTKTGKIFFITSTPPLLRTRVSANQQTNSKESSRPTPASCFGFVRPNALERFQND